MLLHVGVAREVQLVLLETASRYLTPLSYRCLYLVGHLQGEVGQILTGFLVVDLLLLYGWRLGYLFPDDELLDERL